MAISFDTHRFVKKLMDAGVPEIQAEAQAAAFKDAHEENLDHLCTKQDLSILRLNLIKWVLGIIFIVSAAQLATLITIMRFHC